MVSVWISLERLQGQEGVRSGGFLWAGSATPRTTQGLVPAVPQGHDQHYSLADAWGKAPAGAILQAPGALMDPVVFTVLSRAPLEVKASS